MKSKAKYMRTLRARKALPKDQRTAICEALAEGRSLNQITLDPKYPSYGKIQRLLRVDEEFRKEFEVAQAIYYQKAADELLDIADDSLNDYVTRTLADGTERRTLDKENIMRANLRVETRKWLLSKLKPRDFGSKEPEQAKISGSLADLKDLIQLVTSVARQGPKTVEAEVIDVKEIEDKKQ